MRSRILSIGAEECALGLIMALWKQERRPVTPRRGWLEATFVTPVLNQAELLAMSRVVLAARYRGPAPPPLRGRHLLALRRREVHR